MRSEEVSSGTETVFTRRFCSSWIPVFSLAEIDSVTVFSGKPDSFVGTADTWSDLFNKMMSCLLEPVSYTHLTLPTKLEV